MTRIVRALAEIGDEYDAVFCDLWGCLHDGVRAFPEAVAALAAMRAAGRPVILVTNSPRPAPEVAGQLDRLGVPRDAWDAIATSGDAAQAGLLAGDVGARVFHVGPPRDEGFFTNLAPDLPRGLAVTRVGSLAEAEGIVCTGLFDDETETPEDYRALVLEGTARRLPMLCANPDIVVHRGPDRLFCAGAIAAAYEAAGGRVHYYGKPHAPIFALARLRLAALGAEAEETRILMVGDGIATDIAGGIGEGFDTLLVTGGLAREETGTPPGGDPDPARLAAFTAGHRLSPTAAIGYLR